MKGDLERFAADFWDRYGQLDGSSEDAVRNMVKQVPDLLGNIKGLGKYQLPMRLFMDVSLKALDGMNEKFDSEGRAIDQSFWLVNRHKAQEFLEEVYEAAENNPSFREIVKKHLEERLGAEVGGKYWDILSSNPDVLNHIGNTSQELYDFLKGTGYFPNHNAPKVLSDERAIKILSQLVTSFRDSMKMALEQARKAAEKESQEKFPTALEIAKEVERLREEKEKEEKQREEVFLAENEGRQAALSLVTEIVAASRPGLVKTLGALGVATTQISDAARKYSSLMRMTEDKKLINPFVTPHTELMGMFTFMSSVVGGLSLLVALLSEPQPSPEQLILDEITRTRKQLQEMSIQLNSRFDSVDERLSHLFNSMLAEFASIEGKLGAISDNLDSIHVSLQRIEERIVEVSDRIDAYQRTEAARKLRLQHLHCLKGKENFPGIPLSDREYKVCLEKLSERGSSESREMPFVNLPPNRTGVRGLNSSYPHHSVAENLDNLLHFSSSVDQSIRVSSSVIPNFDEWALVTRLILATMEAYPEYSKNVSPKFLDPLIAAGEEIAVARKSLVTQNGEGPSTIRTTVLESLLLQYEQQLSLLPVKVAGFLEAHNGTQFSGLDPWKTAADMGAGVVPPEVWGQRLQSLREIRPCEGSEFKSKAVGFTDPLAVIPPELAPVLLVRTLSSDSPLDACLDVRRTTTDEKDSCVVWMEHKHGGREGVPYEIYHSLCHKEVYSDVSIGFHLKTGVDKIVDLKLDGRQRFLTKVKIEDKSEQKRPKKGKFVSLDQFRAHRKKLESLKKTVMSVDEIFLKTWGAPASITRIPGPLSPRVTYENQTRVLYFQEKASENFEGPLVQSAREKNQKLRLEMQAENLDAAQRAASHDERIRGTQENLSLIRAAFNDLLVLTFPVRVELEDHFRSLVRGDNRLISGPEQLAIVLDGISAKARFESPQGLSATSFESGDLALNSKGLRELLRAMGDSKLSPDPLPKVEDTLLLLRAKRAELGFRMAVP